MSDKAYHLNSDSNIAHSEGSDPSDVDFFCCVLWPGSMLLQNEHFFPITSHSWLHQMSVFPYAAYIPLPLIYQMLRFLHCKEKTALNPQHGKTTKNHLISKHNIMRLRLRARCTVAAVCGIALSCEPWYLMHTALYRDTVTERRDNYSTKSRYITIQANTKR